VTSANDPERTISSGRQDEFGALERAGSSDRQDVKPTSRGRAAIAISVDGATLVSTADHNQHRVKVQHAAKCVQAFEVEEPTIAD
jgi:hypothetical protein